MAIEIYANEWNSILDELPPEHKVILQQSLPTSSFRLLLDTYIREHNDRLKNISLDRDDKEFKQKYILLKQQSELAEGLLNFVQTLNIKPTS
jgi:hypothetical protein